MEKDLLKCLAYMIAADKLDNLLFNIKNTLDFVGEYSLKPDEEAKLVLGKEVEKISLWLKS